MNAVGGRRTPFEAGDGFDGPDMSEERFRVDRRKLECMIASSDGDGLGMVTSGATLEESGDEFFTRVMRETNTAITWPCKLKIGAKSKKDPHVKVRGRAADVAKAKEMIVAVLDTKSNRVALKMDVPHTEHSHVIGKGGCNIRSIMEETNCHIHFPDCSGSERRTHSEKSSQVSITGQPECVEIARQRIRATLPLVLSFELPPDTVPDSTSPPIPEILAVHNVSVSFRARSRSSEMFCQVRGCQRQEEDIVAATEKLWELWRSQSMKRVSATTAQVTTTMDIAQQHQSALRGRANINSKYVEKEAGVQISFPSSFVSSSVVVRGPARAVCLARRLLSSYLPLVLMFDVPEEKGVASSALSSLADSLAEQWDIHVSITPKSKQMSHAVKVKGSEGKASHLYQARLALLQNERKPLRSPVHRSSDSQLLQDLKSQDEGIANALDLRPQSGSLSLSWSAQQLQMETSNRSQQPSSELSQYQFHKSFNEDIFGKTDGSERLSLSSGPGIYLKSSDLSDSFGHSSDNTEKPSNNGTSSLGPPPGISTPTRFSPHPSPIGSPAKAMKKSNPGRLLATQPNPIMTDSTPKPSSGGMVKSTSLDSHLSSRATPPRQHSLQPTNLQTVFNQESPSTGATSAMVTSDGSFTRSGTMSTTAKSSSLDEDTLTGRINDYDTKRLQATRVVEQGRKPTTEVVRTPTDFWTGHGFSKSSPEHVLREQLAQQQRFNPSMATMYETEDGKPPAQNPSSDLLGSIPVPLGSTVQNSRFAVAPSVHPKQVAPNTSFGSIGDSPSKKRPTNQTDLNWSLWQSWQRSAEAEATGAQSVDKSQAVKISGLSHVKDLSGLLSLLDLTKYQSTFEEQEVDLPIFLTLSEADLKDIGIATFGARRRMILAINELKQVYQKQIESRSPRHMPSSHAAAHDLATARPLVAQHLPGHVVGITPLTSSSGASASGASISAPSSDCSNSEGSGGMLQDFLQSSSGRVQMSASVTPAAAAVQFDGTNASTVVPSMQAHGKKQFPMSQSSHW